MLAAASCVSPATLAQLLDFDAACASPPCAAGSAYAVAAVGIAPSSLQIVAAGTNGLTGPVGSRFLTVPDPPYQVQITLPRRATSASFWLSRDDSANGNVLVTVTALRNGAVVQTRNRLLTVFGQWVIASIADATGFDQLVCSPDPARRYRASASMRARRRHLLRLRGRAAYRYLLQLGGVARQSPRDAGMHARPVLSWRERHASADGVVHEPPGQRGDSHRSPADHAKLHYRLHHRRRTRVCESDPYAVTVRQRALLDVAFTFTPVTGPWTASVTPAYNENGSLFNAGTPGETAHTAASGQRGTVYNRMWLELDPGSTYIFAAFASRIAGSGDLTQGRCRLDVTLFPASSSTAPFDAGD